MPLYMEAMAKFHHYLIGHKFTIKTDQKILKSLMEQTIFNHRNNNIGCTNCWGYDFTIEYKPGRKNIATDALFHSCLLAFSSPHTDLVTQIVTTVDNDSILAAVKAACVNGQQHDPNFQVCNNVLFWKSKIMVPSVDDIKLSIMHEFHSSRLGGHAGIARTKARIAATFYWPSMAKDIRCNAPNN